MTTILRESTRMTDVVAIDTETSLFYPGCMAPPLACVSWCDGTDAGVVHHTEAKPLIETWLKSDVLLVGQNVAYDVAVLMNTWPEHIPLWFQKYNRAQVTDTMLRQQLLDIAKGRFRWELTPRGTWIERTYNLSDMHVRHCGTALDKDTFRLRYGEFRTMPLAEWPAGAIEYAKEDARATLRVFRAQGGNVTDEYRQARYALALHLTSVWGVRTDPERVEALLRGVQARMRELEPQLRDARLVRPNGRKNTAVVEARVVAMTEGEPKRTKKGEVCVDAEACEKTGDPLLAAYAEWSTLGTVLHKDGPLLRAGKERPVHTRFDMAESGRTTSRAPNLQNASREGGVRECFVPREGMVFVGVDFAQLELRTVAETLMQKVGWSRLAELLNGGLDAHAALGAQLLGISYEEMLSRLKAKDHDAVETRRISKAANFGFLGGCSAKTFVEYAAKSGLVITQERAEEVRRAWFRTYPEFLEYFAQVKCLKDFRGNYKAVSIGSDRVRTCDRFTETANHFPQALGADVSKFALYCTVFDCYANTKSPLFGCRPVLFVHDEIVIECPESRCHEAGMELASVMQMAANRLLQHVPMPELEAVAMRQYSKNAKQLFHEGRLIPWSVT